MSCQYGTEQIGATESSLLDLIMKKKSVWILEDWDSTLFLFLSSDAIYCHYEKEERNIV